MVLSPKNFTDYVELLDHSQHHPQKGQHLHYSNSTPDIAYQIATASTRTSQIVVPSAISEEDEATEESRTILDNKGTDTVDGSDRAITQSKTFQHMKKESGKESTPAFEICPTVGGLL